MELKQFWKKKEIFSYICAVMVFLRHCSTMANYSGFSDSMNILNTWIKYGVNGGVNTAFFILSGFLMFRNYTPDKGKEKIKKRMTSLGIPFVIWNILGMLFAIALSMPIFQRFLIGRQVFSFSIKNVFLGVFHFKYNTPFWFVFNLTFFALLTPVFDYLSKRKVISVISFLILTLCIKKYTLLPPFIFTVPQSILFYFAGVFIAKYCKNWFMSSCTKRESVFFLLIFLASTVYYTYYSLIGETSPFYRDIIIQILFAISLWKTSDLFTRVLPDSVSRLFTGSFWIYALHMNIGAIVTKVMYLLLPRRCSYGYLNFLLTIILTLGMIHLIRNVCRKFVPKVYFLLSGGRA